MKKIIFAILILFVWTTSAMSATEILPFTYAESINESNDTVTYAYPITVSVTMGADQVFRIEAPDNAGLIKEFTIVTLSPLYNAWLSIVENAGITELDKNPIVLENIVYSESPTINPPRVYRDIMGNVYLWLTISNLSATVTGTSGILVVTYWRV
ncbi:MAG: hypothetical protein KAS30_01475 [Candidatus Diapherotrites archaeon]|nr:hypothetical protein [Candidatus Diapherotrites archaeon]